MLTIESITCIAFKKKALTHGRIDECLEDGVRVVAEGIGQRAEREEKEGEKIRR